MRVQVFCARRSEGADALVAALRSIGVDTLRARSQDEIASEDLAVAWGAPLLRAQGVTLNAFAGSHNKLDELEVLHASGVAVPEFVPRYTVDARRARQLDRDPQWLKRTAHHRAGRDLRYPRRVVADFWTRKLDIVEEYRVHIFRGKSVRAGKKVHAPESELAGRSRVAGSNRQTRTATARGRSPHPWIRSYYSGWDISYTAVDLPDEAREAAKAAVSALGLDFGAVDLGLVAGGLDGGDGRRTVVFEINTAPSLSILNTALAYAKPIARIAKRGGNSGGR